MFVVYFSKYFIVKSWVLLHWNIVQDNKGLISIFKASIWQINMNFHQVYDNVYPPKVKFSIQMRGEP